MGSQRFPDEEGVRDLLVSAGRLRVRAHTEWTSPDEFRSTRYPRAGRTEGASVEFSGVWRRVVEHYALITRFFSIGYNQLPIAVLA